MKSCTGVFFISLIGFIGLVICNCTGRLTGENHSSHTGAVTETPGHPPAPSPLGKDGNRLSEKTVTLSVKGIVCQSCKNSLETLLKAEEGISSAEVFWQREKNNVIVTYDPQKINLERIKAIINETWEVVP